MPHFPERLHPKSWLTYIVNHPRRVIFLIALITVVFALRLPFLTFETCIYHLTIEDLPETHIYNSFKKAFGCEEVILVVARTKGVFNPETFAQIEQLSESLSRIHGVKRVISLPDIKKAMDITDKWDLSEFDRVVSSVGLFNRNLISHDKKSTTITLALDDIDQKDQVIHAVRGLIKEYQHEGFTLYPVGMPVVSSALSQFTQQDFMVLPAITFCFIGLVLFFFFGSLRGILIPSGTILLALIWTFGLMAWTGTPVSLLTMIVPVFLIAVGTAYCMYVFSEYLASVKQSGSSREAAVQSFGRLCFPTILAVLTTTIGLGSLLVNRVHNIREFAIFSCFGILSLLILLLSFLPAVMGLLPLPKRSWAFESLKTRVSDHILSTIVRLNLRHQKIVLPLIGIIAVIAGIGMFRIQVETNPVEFFKEDTPLVRDFHDIYQDLSGAFPLSVVIEARTEEYFEDPQHLKTLERIQSFLQTLPQVDKTISIVDYLKLIHYASNQYDPVFYDLPEAAFEIRMLINSFKSLLGQDMLSRFMSPGFSSAHIMLRTHLSSSIDFLSTEGTIREYLSKHLPDGVSSQVTGFGIVMSHSSQLISEGQIKSLGLTLVLVFAIMFLLFMSRKMGVIALLPNCFPIVVTFGVMGWAGIPLSLATSLIASIAIGLAIDDTIHYLVQYNRTFREDLNKQTALEKTVRHLGQPIIFTSVAISVGFSVLMFSSFKPTSVFGLLMVITMVSALVGDLLLLPSLILHVELVTLWDLLKLKLGKDPQKGIPLFDGLSPTQIRHLIMAGSIKNYHRGTVVLKKGEISDAMYVIVSGELQIMDAPDSILPGETVIPEKLITLLKEGEVVGEMGLIRSCRRSATVIASQTTELLQIDERMVKRLQWLYPRTAHRFFFNLMKVLCDRLENATRLFLDQTIMDRLTGLHTRDFFIHILKREAELSRSIKDKYPLSLLIISLDDLAKMTLQHGYELTDAILRNTAGILTEKVQERDRMCRFNANQFACALPGVALKEAQTLAKQIQERLWEKPIQIDSQTFYVHVTVGVSSTQQKGENDIQTLIDDAFRSLDQNREYVKTH